MHLNILIEEFISILENQAYVVTKPIEVTVVPFDIDIICVNPNSLASEVIRGLVDSNGMGTGDKVVVNKKSNFKVHLDFFDNKKLVLKLDLNSKLEADDGLILRDTFLLKAIARAKVVSDGYGEYVLSQNDALIVRYFEYLRMYRYREDKLKHLHYVTSALESPEERQDFFARFDRCVTFEEKQPENSQSLNRLFIYVLDDVKRIYKSFKVNGIMVTSRKILKKLRRNQ